MKYQTFDFSSYIDITKKDCFQWSTKELKYDKYSFRGLCTLNKEEFQGYVVNNLKLNQRNFKVIKENVDLYMSS